MRKFVLVNIVETSRKIVPIEITGKASGYDAAEFVEKEYKDGKIVLTADDFTGFEIYGHEYTYEAFKEYDPDEEVYATIGV